MSGKQDLSIEVDFVAMRDKAMTETPVELAEPMLAEGRALIAQGRRDNNTGMIEAGDRILAALSQRDETAETFASINQWCDDTFGRATIPQIIARAKEEFDELEQPEADHAIEAADVVICLCRVPGFADALQRKMQINRGRKWRLVGSGTGYHIPDAIEAGEHKGAAL